MSAIDRFIALSLLKETHDKEEGCIINCSECEFTEECTKLDGMLKELFGERVMSKKKCGEL